MYEYTIDHKAAIAALEASLEAIESQLEKVRTPRIFAELAQRKVNEARLRLLEQELIAALAPKHSDHVYIRDLQERIVDILGIEDI